MVSICVSKSVIGVAVLALLFAAAVASDCSNKQTGRYCTSPTTYEWCYSSEPSVTLQCPVGTQCLCSYVANGNPCGSVGDKIEGCETEFNLEEQLQFQGSSNPKLVEKRQQTTAQALQPVQPSNVQTGTTTCSLSSVSAAGASKKFITYFSNWAQYRPGDCAYDIAMIQGNLYTHINFAFAKLDGTTFAVLPYEANDITDPNAGVAQGNYDKINSLKAKYPHLKTLLSLGGWSFGATIFSRMASQATSRAAFITSVMAFVRQYNFDGIDVDWEYPAHTGQGGKPEDTVNFSTLLGEMRAAIESEVRGNKEKLLLTIAAPAGASAFNGLQLNVIHQHLDWINLMSYDFHGGWEPTAGFNTPLYCPPGETMCIDYAIDAYIRAGTPSEKLVLGLGTYGRSWTLANPANTNPGAATAGPGTAGKCTGEAGILAYYEVKEMLAAGATEKIDSVAVAAYAYLGNQWVSYDSPATIKSKIEYAHAKALGGAMVWALDLDAPKGGFYELQCIAAANLFGSAGANDQPTTGSNDNPTNSEPNTNNGPNSGTGPTGTGPSTNSGTTTSTTTTTTTTDNGTNNNTNTNNNNTLTGTIFHATGEPASSGRPSPALAVIFAALTGAAVFLALSTMR